MDLQQTPSLKQQTDGHTFVASSSAQARARQNLDKGDQALYLQATCMLQQAYCDVLCSCPASFALSVKASCRVWIMMICYACVLAWAQSALAAVW